MKVRDWIKRFPGLPNTLPPESSLDEIGRCLLSKSCARDVYVISDASRVVGHISHTKLAPLILAEHRPVHTRRQIMDRIAVGTAKDIMETQYPRAHPEEDLDDVIDRQLHYAVEDMSVIDHDGALVGAINLTEILRERIGQNR